MNTKKAGTYEATFSLDYDSYMDSLTKGIFHKDARLQPNRTFVFKKIIAAMNRERAVWKAAQWYWKEYKGALGQLNEIMVLNDPMHEVVYDDDFDCGDRGNRYLDSSSLERLLKDSNGELELESKESTKHHPANSVKRKKRRRKFNERVGVNLYRSAGTGVLYYVTTYFNKNNKRLRKNNKLVSKCLVKAQKEIERKFGKTVNS